MSTNPRYGRTETPVNMLEPIEIDFMAGQPFDPSKYGRTETPVNMLEPIEIDFAVPHLILTLRLADAAATTDPDVLALDLLNLVDALSGYEKSLGGRGLRLHGKEYADGAIALTLAPVAADNAGERLDGVKRLLAGAAGRPRPHPPGPSLLDAITGLEQSPVERCQVAVARRPWSVEVRIAMPA